MIQNSSNTSLLESKNPREFEIPVADDEHIDLWIGLSHDLLIAKYEASVDDCNKRTYIRSFFAMVEGIVASIKQLILIGHEQGGVTLSLEEIITLREEIYEIDNRGEISVQKRYAAIEKSIRYIIQLIVRQHVPGFKLDASGQGWFSFKSALTVRHRITHPKKASDLSVTEDDLANLEQASSWFFQHMLYTALVLLYGHLHEMVSFIAENPSTRKGVLSAVKKAYPKTNTRNIRLAIKFKRAKFKLSGPTAEAFARMTMRKLQGVSPSATKSDEQFDKMLKSIIKKFTKVD